ncbi:MAG: hypothetical protein ABSB67_13195 [Bryobacteraceae bacterium]|jgi:hypothetical protein
MRFTGILLCGFLIAAAALAQDDDRPDLSGKWQINQAKGGSGGTLNIEAKDDSLHYSEAARNGETVEFDCTTDGKECNMTDGGRKAKVSVWYNGGSLVMLETKGNDVVKRRFTLTNASTLEMEVIPIVPPGKTGKLVFTKQS